MVPQEIGRSVKTMKKGRNSYVKTVVINYMTFYLGSGGKDEERISIYLHMVNLHIFLYKISKKEGSGLLLTIFFSLY